MSDERFKIDGPTPEDCAAGRHLLMSSHSNPFLLICTECPHSVDLKAERAEVEQLQGTFDLRWKADMRAIKRWHEAHPGEENTWPDHADLCVWLLEQMDSLQAGPEMVDELARLEREIAEEGAIALLECELRHAEDDWLDTTAYDDVDPVAELRYLELRGLLERHLDRPELVRVKDQQE